MVTCCWQLLGQAATIVLMTKEALSEKEQAMECLPGFGINGQSLPVKVLTTGHLLLKGLAKSIVMGLSAFLRMLLVHLAVLLRNHQGRIIVWKEGRIHVHYLSLQKLVLLERLAPWQYPSASRTLKLNVTHMQW